jgi:hypothetical protein
LHNFYTTLEQSNRIYEESLGELTFL